MATHVRLLGILHIVFAGIGLLIGLAALAILGGIAGLVGIADRGGDSSWIAAPLLGGIGLAVFVFAALLSLPGLIAGFGLLGRRPWARTLTIVLSAFELLNVPFGTVLGIYGLWVLLSTGSERLFPAP